MKSNRNIGYENKPLRCKFSMTEIGKGILHPVVVPLNLALEMPVPGYMDGRRAHPLVSRIRDDAFHKRLPNVVTAPIKWSPGQEEVLDPLTEPGDFNGEVIALGAELPPGFKASPAACFAPLPTVSTLFEAGYNSAAPCLHSRTQFLRIVLTGRSNLGHVEPPLCAGAKGTEVRVNEQKQKQCIYDSVLPRSLRPFLIGRLIALHQAHDARECCAHPRGPVLPPRPHGGTFELAHKVNESDSRYLVIYGVCRFTAISDCLDACP